MQEKNLIAVVLITSLAGCGGGSDSNSANTPSSSNKVDPPATVEKFSDVKYDLSQAFKDYSKAVAKLDVKFDISGAVYNENQKLLIDAEGKLIDFVVNTEPNNNESKCNLVPIKPTLSTDHDYIDVKRIGSEQIYLLTMKNFPTSFSESTCKYKSGDRSKNVVALANTAGDIKVIDFDIERLIESSDLAINSANKTFAVSTNGDVYKLYLDSSTQLPLYEKIAITGNNKWQYATGNLLMTQQSSSRFNVYDLKNKKNYNYISDKQIKSQGVSQLIDAPYFSDWKDQYYVLAVNENQGEVTKTAPISKNLLLGSDAANPFKLNGSRCEVEYQGTTYPIYKPEYVSYFSGDIKAQNVSNYFTCRSFNGRYLAVQEVIIDGDGVRLGDYNNYDFAMKSLYHTPSTQLVNGTLYTQAGDNDYGTQEIFKLDASTKKVVALSELYELPKNNWVSGITPINL